MKRVVLRERAVADIAGVVDHYVVEASEATALAFIDMLEQALAHIARDPATGSPRYAHELHLPGLRVWPVKRHPHVVFYFERADHIDVWRVLHGRRDIPASLG